MIYKSILCIASVIPHTSLDLNLVVLIHNFGDTDIRKWLSLKLLLLRLISNHNRFVVVAALA